MKYKIDQIFDFLSNEDNLVWFCLEIQKIIDSSIIEKYTVMYEVTKYPITGDLDKISIEYKILNVSMRGFEITKNEIDFGRYFPEIAHTCLEYLIDKMIIENRNDKINQLIF